MSKSAGRRKRHTSRLAKKMNVWGYLFVLPGLLILLIFRLIPMIMAGYLSLTKYDLFTSPKFIGIKTMWIWLKIKFFYRL